MRYHLIGIGGTGMGALAGLLKAAGHDVRGSDRGVYPPMSDQLAALEIPVFEEFSDQNLDWGPDAVVVGNVCTRDHVEVVAAQQRGFALTSLPAVLGDTLLADHHSLVVAGTHGKTTTSALLVHILLTAGRDPSCFIGGVPVGLGRGWRLGGGYEFVVEGDEYDSAFFDKESKFLHYRPDVAILTSVELDHVDIFSSMEAVRDAFRKFVRLLPEQGLLVVCGGSREALAIARADARCRVETYLVASSAAAASGRALSAGEVAPAEPGEEESEPLCEDGHPVTWLARDVTYLKSGRVRFSLARGGERFEEYETSLAGEHNIGNAVAAVAIAHSVGVPPEVTRTALSTFPGVKRRQEVRGVAQGVHVIDDYAHHPTAVASTLKALRRRFDGCRLLAIYEPRSATSRRKTFQREFADALAHADAAVIGPLYDPSRIAPEERFDPEKLALDLHQGGTPARYIEQTDEIVAHAIDLARPGDVVVVFSSGAFDGLHDKLLAALGDAVMPARREDAARIRALLKEVQLGDDGGAGDDFHQFLVLANEDGLAGCVALEVIGEEAILHSLAVKKQFRGVGYGWMLADTAISTARRRGVRRIYLLTANASDFFAEKLGFRVIDLSTVTPEIAGSHTFQSQRGKSSVAMRLDL